MIGSIKMFRLQLVLPCMGLMITSESVTIMSVKYMLQQCQKIFIPMVNHIIIGHCFSLRYVLTDTAGVLEK